MRRWKRDSRQAALKRLDELFAEPLDGGGAIKEFLGPCSNLTDALRVVAELSAEAGIEAALAHLLSCAAKLGFLLDFSSSEFSVKYQAAVTDLNELLGIGLLPAEVRELIAKRLARLAAGGGDAAPKMRAAAPTSPVDLSRKTVADGAYVFRQDDPGDEAYLIATGRIKIVIKSHA